MIGLKAQARLLLAQALPSLDDAQRKIIEETYHPAWIQALKIAESLQPTGCNSSGWEE